MVRESGSNWKCYEYKWWWSSEASGLNFWWMDQTKNGEGVESIQNESNPTWNLIQKQTSLRYKGVVWVQPLGVSKGWYPLKNRWPYPHLLHHFNTWHKGTVDFIISWSCLQRLFCVKRSAYNVPAGLKELREPWEKIENHADSVEAGNGWRLHWKVGVVQLIQADRVGDKNGFLSLQPSRGPTLSNLFDGERYAPSPLPLW